jgi:2-polyprenyl-3-methyl-5-hydroxy-6-metoxy-1,4-benzoquinol methylase
VKTLITGKTWEEHSVDDWNEQWSTSTWTYLSDLEQVPRYAIIEGWRRRLKPSGSVLDIGCGAGVFFDHLPSDGRLSYTGVDISQTAVDQAARKIRDVTLQRFVLGNLLTFMPPEGSLYDVVIFNEVLYYVPNPCGAVDRYRGMLAPGGLFIVSMFDENARIWREVDNSLAGERLQTVMVSEVRSRKKWHLGVYQTRS